MFHTLDVVLDCLPGVCSVFVACAGRVISSPYIDERAGISTPIFHRIPGVHVRVLCTNHFRFRSVPRFVASPVQLTFCLDRNFYLCISLVTSCRNCLHILVAALHATPACCHPARIEYTEPHTMNWSLDPTGRFIMLI